MPQPLAIGLLGVDRYVNPVDRRRAHLGVATFAHREGYALLEIFEVVGESVRDESALTTLRSLAWRAEASVLLVNSALPACVLQQAVLDTELRSVVIAQAVRKHSHQQSVVNSSKEIPNDQPTKPAGSDLERAGMGELQRRRGRGRDRALPAGRGRRRPRPR